MNSIPEELLAIILSKLPIQKFTTFKVVCKQWESILESPYFRDLFLSTHQNSHSWSLMSWDYKKEHIAQYGFNSWGLERSLGSYISSFLTKKFGSQRHKYRVWSYAEVGLILISEVIYKWKNRSLYVANPITHECIEVPSPNAHDKDYSWPLGITTRTDQKGVVLDYKVVLYYSKNNLWMIYSSHTGLWSVYKTVYNTALYAISPIILHETFHWVARITGMDEDVIVSFNVDATGTDSIQFRTTRFPDSGKETNFISFCSTCQGSLMYMNVVPVNKADGTLEDMLCVWRLKSWEWQLVSEITWDLIDDTGGSRHFPLGINPFDAKIVYFGSTNMRKSLLSINLHNRNMQRSLLHSEMERDRNGIIQLKSTEFEKSCVFPQWVHKIPVTTK